jgi:pimeloyl-ACP methyl ester carboxylesterase
MQNTVKTPNTLSTRSWAPAKPDERTSVSTPVLDIEVMQWNADGQRSVILAHGWPDSADGWGAVAAALAHAGWRVIVPSLRGFGQTKFRNADTPRSGQLSALGRDMVDLIGAMGLDKPALVGHDWGARAVANAVGLEPDIASHLALISVGYGTNSPDQAMSMEQTRRYWYHWLMATARGEKTVREHGTDFARIMWDTWSPQGWYSEAEFEYASKAFSNPDWAEITLHSYRHRWGHAKGFAEYAKEEQRLHPAPQVHVPTLMLHGEQDYCNVPAMSAGKEGFFEGRYERVLLPGVGHFPQREDPVSVARELLRFCA